jgi:hypothetical protein
MPAIHNARIPASRAALSNLALAVAIAGFVAPLVTGQLQRASQALVMLAWIGTGVAPHFGAQVVLGGLRQ